MAAFRRSKGVGTLYSSVTSFLPSDHVADEPRRVRGGARAGPKGPRRAGKSWAVQTSLRLVVLHAVAGCRCCWRAARWVPARGAGRGAYAQRHSFNIPIVAARQPRCQPAPTDVFRSGVSCHAAQAPRAWFAGVLPASVKNFAGVAA